MTERQEAVREKALGAFYGLALGDALGMPTQIMSRAAITARFGRVAGFEPGPVDNPVAAGLPAGSVTDDTEQAVLVGRLLVDGGGRLDPHLLADALLAWEAEMKARGSFDLLGPSTKAALSAVAAGVPIEEAAKGGTTNGAAMRVTPVGIAVPYQQVGVRRFVDEVAESCQVTHATGLGIAGASAVAAAVSAGISGAGIEGAFDAAVAAAGEGAGRGHWVAGADIATRIEWAREVVDGVPEDRAVDLISELIGTSVAGQESVPAAFAVLALAGADPWRCGLIAANLGGDCDTIGAMACAIAGAVGGLPALPAAAVDTLDRTNPGLGLIPLTDRLLALRAGGAGIGVGNHSSAGSRD
jgi:ADP-ribosylglycohydrolase